MQSQAKIKGGVQYTVLTLNGQNENYKKGVIQPYFGFINDAVLFTRDAD